MTVWRKSSHSGGQGGTNECVELARLPHAIGIRDSKHPTGPVLKLSRRQTAAFLNAVKVHRHTP